MLEPDSKAPTVWRTAGGDNSRRGLFGGAIQLDPKPARRLAVKGAVQAAVVFDSRGTVFVADMAGFVQALRPDGTQVWQKRLDGGISATPALTADDELLFVGTHAGGVYALRTTDGGIAWHKSLPTKSDARILSDLLVLPKRSVVVLNSWGGRYHALDTATGDERQSWEAGISPYGGAAADSDETIYCVRAVWEKGVQFVRVSAAGQESVLDEEPVTASGANRSMVAAAPVIDEGRDLVFFIVNREKDGTLHAWDVKSNAIRWSQRFSRCVAATPALMADGTILVADLAGLVHAFGPDGSRRYRYASGCEYLLASAVGDQHGTAYFGDPLGRVHRVDNNGVGGPIFEAPRAIQARPSFSPNNELWMPCTDRNTHVFYPRLSETRGNPR